MLHFPRLQYKRKLIILLCLMILLTIVQYIFPNNLPLASLYASYIFRPFQSLRTVALGAIPFSVGDFLYLFGFLYLLAIIIRWVYFSVRWRTHRHYLGQSFLNSIITLAIVYLLFFIGWGGNYYKPTLTKYWKLKVETSPDTAMLAQYDTFLIHRLNALAPTYVAVPFDEVGARAKSYYKEFTNSRTRLHGLKAKSSLYGFFMQYLGIQGYYNPFTGEAQVNRFLPSFMLPFVVCHEMAHQSGIAAEDDANLLAYALCTVSADNNFSYSGYFNLWLYTQSRLKKIDSVAANGLLTQLNPISLNQLDTLRAIRRKYRNGISDYSGILYDSYLRMHNQKDGINSYNNVAYSAWAWEQKRVGSKEPIAIP